MTALKAAIAERPGFSEEKQKLVRPWVASPQTTTAHPHVLYRFFDASDRLLYVGISFDAMRRMSQHQRAKPWWTDVARSTVEHFPDHDTAREAERVAIHDEHPLHNIAA